MGLKAEAKRQFKFKVQTKTNLYHLSGTPISTTSYLFIQKYIYFTNADAYVGQFTLKYMLSTWEMQAAGSATAIILLCSTENETLRFTV